MFANVRPVGRESRMTPSHVETVAGRLKRPPKSPARVTFAPRCSGTGRAEEDRRRRVRRDDLSRIIQMFPKKNKTPRAGKALGADEASEATNLNGKDTKSASMLFAEADRIIETFPSFMTRKGKHQAGSQVLRLFLAALAASRPGRAV